VWYNRGNARLLAGQPARAVEDYDQALRIAPGMREAAFNRARALERPAR
jgi:tetratricopeptide (TPR) repeat protein